MCGHTRDPVIYSKFHRNPFMGFGAPGGQNLAFPITLASRFYNSLYYRTSRDAEFKHVLVHALPANMHTIIVMKLPIHMSVVLIIIFKIQSQMETRTKNYKSDTPSIFLFRKLVKETHTQRHFLFNSRHENFRHNWSTNCINECKRHIGWSWDGSHYELGK